MPRPFDRHSRKKDDWGEAGSRSAERAAAAAAEEADPSKRAPGRKDKNRCKAAHGAPHAPAVAREPYGLSARKCEWNIFPWRDGDSAQPHWTCRHHEECANCGKILRHFLRPEECPDFHPVTPEEQARIEAAAARFREEYRTRSRRGRRMPVITGRQSYRRKRNT